MSDLNAKERKKNRENALQRTFAKNYVETGFNGAEAYRRTNGNRSMTPQSASTRAINLLNKSEVQKAITDYLPSNEESVRIIRQAYTAKRPRDIKWETLLQYLRTEQELKGNLNQKTGSNSVNIGLVIDRTSDET